MMFVYDFHASNYRIAIGQLLVGLQVCTTRSEKYYRMKYQGKKLKLYQDKDMFHLRISVGLLSKKM